MNFLIRNNSFNSRFGKTDETSRLGRVPGETALYADGAARLPSALKIANETQQKPVQPPSRERKAGPRRGCGRSWQPWQNPSPRQTHPAHNAAANSRPRSRHGPATHEAPLAAPPPGPQQGRPQPPPAAPNGQGAGPAAPTPVRRALTASRRRS